MSERKTVKLFVSYSHDDESYFSVFNDGFLKVVGNAKIFDWEIWTDKNIHVGTFWDTEIQSNVQGCDVAILLVSVGFMSSKYIKEKEYEEFIQRHEQKGIVIIPVVFAPCDFESWEDLSKLQFFKPNGAKFGHAELNDFTYADLIKFNEKNGLIIQNPNIQRYHIALMKVIEDSYLRFINSEPKKIPRASYINFTSNKLFDFPKPITLFYWKE